MADDKQQDKLLPIANVGKIMKQILPPSAKISKEAKEIIQECATEFISFVTGEASDKCHKNNRRTLKGDDICWALSSLGFDHYAEAMLRYLHKYKEFERDKFAKSKSASNEEDGAHGASIPNLFSLDREDLLPNESRTSETLFEFRVLDKGESSRSTKPASKQDPRLL